MSDLISRQAAIDALEKISFSYWFEYGEYISEDPREIEIINSNKALETIEALPSAQPERKWIPCSERLPDMWDERYLVSLAWGGIGVMEYKSTGFHNYGYFTPVPIESITAWMPLPEPYREGE